MRKFLRRRWKLLTGIAAASAILYLGVALLATWSLVKREQPFAEPPPPDCQNIQLHTSDGQTLGAWLADSEKTQIAIIYLHGIHSSRAAGLPIIRLLHDRGYTVLAVTLRSHGDSTGKWHDYGYTARADVSAAVALLRQRFPQKRIVILGQSLGAASAIFAAADCAGLVQGYFLESPYRDLTTAVWNRCDRLWPPFNYAAYLGIRLWGPLFLPASPARIAPIDYIGKIPASVPVTIFAGLDDDHARIEEARSLYEKVRSHAKLVTVSGGHHAAYFATHPEQYEKALFDLLDDVEHSGG
jgi:pimeloyl-ACP methyl ester carboxylesterase